MRTTTTLTTLNGSSINGAAGGGTTVGGGARGSQRMQHGSLGSSHATLLSTQSRSRQDLFATRATGVEAAVVAATAVAHPYSHPHPHPHPLPQRTLQTQISQLSSVGDAQSLLEAELQWPEEQHELTSTTSTSSRHKCQHPTANLSQPTMGAIDELSCQSSDAFDASSNGLSRSRLKLTRITRQPQPQPQPQTSVVLASESGAVTGTEAATVAAARGATDGGKVRKAKAKTLKTSTALKGLRAKLNWRARHKDDANGARDHADNVGQKPPSSAVSTERALY